MQKLCQYIDHEEDIYLEYEHWNKKVKSCLI
jgi:hypothetical protein